MTKSVLTGNELMYCEGQIAGIKDVIETFKTLAYQRGTQEEVMEAYDFACDYFEAKGYHTLAHSMPFEWIVREVQILEHQIKELEASKEGKTIPPRKPTTADLYCKYRENGERGMYAEEEGRGLPDDLPDRADPDDFGF